VVQAARLRAAHASPVPAGERLDHGQAITFALDGQQPSPAVLTPTPAVGVLTNRERQVTDLVARGLTNRQIAEALVLSVRTVDGHLESILTKLGFTSRVQVATWAIGLSNATSG